MSKFKRTNRVDMEQILVGAGDQGLATGALAGAGTALNIADQQYGVLSWDFDGTNALGNFITAGATSANVAAIKVLQGTGASANLTMVDPWEVGEKSQVESGVIYEAQIRSFTALLGIVGAYSTDLLHTFDVPVDGNEYGASIKLRSARNDRDFSDNDEVLNFTLSAFDSTGATDATDLLLQSLVSDINSRSKVFNVGTNSRAGTRNLLALAINVGGGAGTAIGTLVSGTAIPVETLASGLQIDFTSTLPFIHSLGKLIDEGTLTGASTIELVDLTTAGNAVNVDSFIVIGLDYDEAAYFDDIKDVRTSVQVNLTEGFRATGYDFTRAHLEGQGDQNTGRQWWVENRERAQLQVHTMQNQPHMDFFSEGFQYVVKTQGFYTSYILDYYDYEDTLTVRPETPKQLIMLLDATAATATTAATAATNIGASNPAIPVTTDDTTTVAALQASLGVWLESARPTSGHSIKGDAAAGAYFV